MWQGPLALGAVAVVCDCCTHLITIQMRYVQIRQPAVSTTFRITELRWEKSLFTSDSQWLKIYTEGISS